MDEPPKAAATAPPSLRRLSRRYAWLVLIGWLAACGAFVWMGALEARVDGGVDDLLPAQHRAPSDAGYLLLQHGGDLSRDELLSVADRVHEVLDSAWIPIVAPAAERDGWLDAHALYLLPASTHDALQERLTDDSIRASVDALRSSMSSPFFGLTMSESRRDPLRLRELTAGAEARASWDAPALASQAAPTPGGDLLAHDGRSLLMATRSARSGQDLAALASQAVGDTVRIADIGPAAHRRSAVEAANAALPKALWIALAGMTLVIAAAMRNVRRTLAALLCIASGALACATFVPLTPVSAPLFILALGLASSATLPLSRVSSGGWAGMLIFACALAPLSVLEFELWARWAPLWAGVIVTMQGITRLVLPALLEVLRVPQSDRNPRIVLRPSPVFALLLSVGTLAGGWWGLGDLRYRGADRLEVAPISKAAAHVRETYFDPGLVAAVHTEGEDAEQALTRAADDSLLLTTLVPAEARVVDTPGALVLPSEELQRRRVGLAKLKLEERLTKLREMLSARGFRPAAFGEFLRSAADPDQVPTPAAALEGPLGRWIRGYMVEHSGGVALQARIHLAPDPDVLPPALQTPDGRTLVVLGPAIGGRMQASSFLDRLGLATGSQLWLAAFIVWLAVRRFSVAIASALAGLSVQAGVLLAMRLLGVSLSPALLPIFLVAGAAATFAAAAACRSTESRTPIFATGVLAAGVAQATAGLALSTSAIPLWADVGVAAAAGSLLASGIGLFVGPGLAALLDRTARPEASSPTEDST